MNQNFGEVVQLNQLMTTMLTPIFVTAVISKQTYKTQSFNQICLTLSTESSRKKSLDVM